MVDRLIVDLNADHTVSVLTWPEDDVLREGGPAFPLVWPLGSNALTDLCWYLEEYLPLPSGVYGEEGPRIAGQLSEWGEALFMAIFGPESPARSAYMWLRTRDNGPELVFRSQTPELLGLPWELMRDPALPTPLALSLAGLSRSLLTIPETVDSPATIGKLRALMVIARPQGKRDVSYQMIARPLIERLPAVRGSVELVVLRPPTLQALATALTAAHERGEPYHIVHFDGHGYQSSGVPPSANPLLDPGSQPAEAGLVFEKQGGGADLVPATKIARVLNDAEVPVVVLNACQSGAIGKDLEAAIATRLLRGGTASVVAMSYNVYAVAAAEFMAGFYERLFAGDSVSAAVTAGRTRMFLNSNRPSRVGDMPLQDWLVPVHYVRRDVRFQQAATDRTGRLPLGEELDQMRTSERGDRSGTGLDPDGTFVGRDWPLSQLESACRLWRAVILHGTGGTGKTELAKAFGRWWRDTGGVEQPEYVFFHSFEPRAATSGLEGVVNQIGRQILQSGFDRLDVTERRAVVDEALSEHRMLLIWDSFETVRSMPGHDGDTRALDEDSCVELRSFLTKLADGKSAVLITSRSPETWLGDIHRINVAGLSAQEANQYADHLLAPYAAARTRRRDPAFGALMDWLDGHPLAMRLTLPHLDTTDPADLLDALRGEAPIEPPAGGNRLTSLPGSIAYSYEHLSAHTCRLLPAIVLLQTAATADVLSVFSGWDQVPSRFRNASEEDWLVALDEAAKTGLLTPAAGVRGIYRIPPSLPAYLAAQWRAEEPASYQADRDAATRAMLIACAVIGDQLCTEMETGDTSAACATVGLHLNTFYSMLDYAIEHHLWPEASLLLSPLMRYWGIQVLHDEADAWLGKIRQASEGATGTHDSAIDIWTTVVLEQLKWQTDHLQFDRAERTARELLAKLESLPSSPEGQSTTASAYHELGDIAHGQGHLDAAVNWYRKALDISVQIGDDEQEMRTRLSLGGTAQEYGDHNAADGHYHRALAIAVAANDQPGIGAAYHAFGYLYEDLRQLDAAHEWYRKALAVHSRTGNRYQMANAAYQLGMIAHRREQLDVAETWYRQALGLYEDLDDKPQIACTYHELGMVAHDRKQLGIAENWYRKALALGQELGNNHQLAATMMQLGLLAEQRDDDAEALDWTIRGAALFSEFRYPVESRAFRYPMSEQALQRLVHLTDRLEDGTLADRWRAITGSELPEIVNSYLIHVRFMRNIEEGEAKYRKSRPPPPPPKKQVKKRRAQKKKNRRTR